MLITKIHDTLPSQFIMPINSVEVTPTSDKSFHNWLTDLASTTNKKLLKADETLQQLASGHSESLHQTMLNLEQAKLSFQLLSQVRNRLMTAYQDILREAI